jgi:threonine dehydrogenase-like Zn-dependent dehydrogenase
MCKVSGAKQVIIADIQSERVNFAVQNKFADAQIVVPMKRLQAIEEKLAFAKEVAEIVKTTSATGEVDAVFECTGVESCLQAAIYVYIPRSDLDVFEANDVVDSSRRAHNAHRYGQSYSNTANISSCS